MSLGFWIGALWLVFFLGLALGLFFGKVNN